MRRLSLCPLRAPSVLWCLVLLVCGVAGGPLRSQGPQAPLLAVRAILNGSQVLEVQAGGEAFAGPRLVTGTSVVGATLQGGAAQCDDHDLESYFAKNGNGPAWEIRWPVLRSGAPGSAQVFIAEAGANDTIGLAAILPGGVFGVQISLPASVWTPMGWTIQSGPNRNQPVGGLAIDLSQLLDAAGQPLGPQVALEGIVVRSPNLDGACALRLGAAPPPRPAPLPAVLASAPEIVFGDGAPLVLDASDTAAAAIEEGWTRRWSVVSTPAGASPVLEAIGPWRSQVQDLIPGRYRFAFELGDAAGQRSRAEVAVWVVGPPRAGGLVSGSLARFHEVRLDVRGPMSSEGGTPNPFTEVRVDVYVHDGAQWHRVPAAFVADGDAGRTHATSGELWRARYRPQREGEHRWLASVRVGPGVAVAEDRFAGTAYSPSDGVGGRFLVGPSLAQRPDFRAEGILRHVARPHLRFSGSDRPYLKGGADSPENLLAFDGFDGTRDDRHRYSPHAGDWNPGDPDWTDERGDSGRNLIGALNYLAAEGMNSVYFLTMNVDGDGRDVWPWIASGTRDRFDVSKLDQWGYVLAHMDRLGLVAHLILQETENDQLLDGGELGPERRLYHREMVARLGSKLGLVWNLGEENTNTDAQRRAFLRHLSELDPLDHPIVVHTYPGQKERVYQPLLGDRDFAGPSLQMSRARDTHAATVEWRTRSEAAGHPWFVCLDEIGPANDGVLPDTADPDHDGPRVDALWGNLMGGGAGAEWYFGYRWPNDDLDCEDWRSRAAMWRQTRYALQAFERHLPFDRMVPADALVSGGAWCLALPGQVWAVYRNGAAAVTLDLEGYSGPVSVAWYDPRNGGLLQAGSLLETIGPGPVALGSPPGTLTRDWLAIVRPLNHQLPELHPGAGPSLVPLSAPWAGRTGFRLGVEGAPANSEVLVLLDVAVQPTPLMLQGQTLLIVPTLAQPPLVRSAQADASGRAELSYDLPLGLPSSLFLQSVAIEAGTPPRLTVGSAHRLDLLGAR